MNQVKGLYIDEHVVRVVALQVSIITIVILGTGWVFPALFLVVDFALRAFTIRPSPLALVARVIAQKLGWKPKLIFAPPKRFAAALGCLFSGSISIFLLTHLYVTAEVIAGILLFFAILESVFRICAGCYVYNWLVVPLLRVVQKNK